VGVHFSVSPEVANAFARSQGGEGGSVIPGHAARDMRSRVLAAAHDFERSRPYQYTFLIFARRMMIQNPITTTRPLAVHITGVFFLLILV